MNPDIDIWQQARELARSMKRITGSLAQKIAQGAFDELAPLLNARQELCDRLDKLRVDYGIISWVAGGENLQGEAGAAGREIGEIFRWLQEEDGRLQRQMRERMLAVKQDLMQVKMMRQAHRHRREAMFPYGAFIDSRR